MTDGEIQKTYNLIREKHEKYLASKGVILPKLKIGGNYAKDALVLIYLARNYPDTKIFSKRELTQFIQRFYPDVNDVQQGRHLGTQKGWNILSSARGDGLAKNFPKNSYKLADLTTPYPAFARERREGFSGDWEELKKCIVIAAPPADRKRAKNTYSEKA